MGLLSERLALLRSKKTAGRAENRSAVRAEQNRPDPSQIAGLEKAKARAEAQLETIDVDKKDLQRIKNLNYSLKEHEEWNELVGERKRAKKQSETHNYSALAELVYQREVQEISHSKEVYEQVSKSGNSIGKSGINQTKPSLDRVNKLAHYIDDSVARKTARKIKNEGDSVGYINEKNRQFNMKLDREYGK